MKKALKIFVPFLVILLGAALTAVMVMKRPKVKPEPRETPVPTVRTVRATPKSHQYKVITQGNVLPRTDIKLVSEIAGRVIEVAPSFAAGGFFDEGDVLVRLDPRDFELAVIRAKSALAEAQVRLQREQAEAEVARKEWETLGNGNANPLLLREPQLAEAQAAIDSARANVRFAELELERTRIKAPFDGRVWSKNVDLGQYLAKGEAVARIYAVDYAEIRLPISLDELGYLDLPHTGRNLQQVDGPAVTLRARFGPEIHEWQGRIVRTEGEIDQRTRMINVVARVDNPYQQSDSSRQPLAVGLFVEAEIAGRTIENAFAVPRAALHGRSEVKIIDSENRLRIRSVQIARIERDQAIVKDGLQEGDQLCISPLDTPVDGMRVRVSENEKTAALQESTQ